MTRKRTSSSIKNNLEKENYIITNKIEINLLNELKETKNIKEFINLLDNQQLKILYNYLNDEYYKGNNLIDDTIFDYIKEVFNNKFNNTSNLVGIVNIEEFKNKVRLPYYVGSMNKIKNNDNNLEKWFLKQLKKNTDKNEFLISEKLDGISGLFVFNSNELKLFTRGNGYEGQDISYLIKYINNIKFFEKQENSNIIENNCFSCRGELIISKKNFQIIKNLNKQNPKNSRNLVAGLINSKSIDTNLIKYIDFIAYEVIKPVLKPSEQFKFLEKFNFNIPNNILLNINQLNKNNSYKINLSNLLINYKNNSKYDIDGIICTHNIIYKRKEENPKYSFAYKDISTQDGAIITVLGIEWNITKDKYLQPVVLFEPTEINSVIISKATGINAKFIEENKINIGSKLFVIRSGDVIPKIEKIIDTGLSDSGSKPENCKYKWDDNKVHYILDEEEDIENIKTELEKKELEHFANKMEFKNIKKGIINKLYDNGYKNIIDILKINKEQLLKIEGIKEKSALNILKSINEKIENCDIIDIIIASNKFGRGFGDKKLILILKELNNLIKKNIDFENEKELDNYVFLKNIIEKNENIKIKKEDLIKIPGIQIKTADKFINKFINVSNFLINLKNNININFNYNKINNNNINHNINKKIKNLNFVFSGFRSNDLEEYVKNNNGNIQDNINSKTNYLIIKENKDKKGKKELKAIENNIPVITINYFQENFMNMN